MLYRIFLLTALKLLLIADCIAVQNDSIQHWRVHLDNRFQYFQGETVAMLGVTGGYCWGKSENEVTVGYYWLTNNGRQALSWATRDLLKQHNQSNRPQLNQLNFVSVGYWHHFYDSKRVRLGIPMEVGYGKGNFYRSDSYRMIDSKPVSSQVVFPIHIAGYGEWKTTKWIGTGLQVGYRHYVNGQSSFAGMHGLFYRVRILGYMSLFRDWNAHIFKKKKLQHPFY